MPDEAADPADPRSLAERIAALDDGVRIPLIDGLSEEKAIEFLDAWCIWARRAQLPPASHWRTWLLLAGRGFGKTRAGAEWVHHLAEEPGKRIALVGPTEDEARAVMVEGAAGILASGGHAARPLWEPSRGVLTWPSGAQAFVHSAANPESLRGPEHDYAWCDEIAKWPRGESAWDNMSLGLRRGARPRVLATTTPRPTPLLRRLIAAPGVAVTRGRTDQNSALSPAYMAQAKRDYGGRAIGRQELDGELIEDFDDALWTRAGLEACRVGAAPEAVRVVIGVDPPAGTDGDACGIVAAMLGADGIAYVIDDASVAGRSPEDWAAAVAACAARHGADRVIAEANNGGAMVESVLRAADAVLPVKRVHASHGKTARAEPVETLYATGRVRHVGAFPALEDELCGLMRGGGYEGPGRSPDRADALVWAVSELMLGKKAGTPRVRLV